MTYEELIELINEFGLKKEGVKLLYNKNFTVATIHNSLLNLETGKISYRLDFISSYIRTMKYEVAKKAAAKRISIIKEIIIHNKKIEIEKDFKE